MNDCVRPSDASPENIDDRYMVFTRTITGLMYCIQKIRTLAVEEFGLKGGSMNCLYHLSRSGQGLTLSELSCLCEEDKAAVSRSVHEMVDSHYARLETTNGSRYRARIYLTDAGLHAALVLDEAVKAAVEEGGRFMTPQMRETFYSCLTGIYKNLQGYIGRIEGEQLPT